MADEKRKDPQEKEIDKAQHDANRDPLSGRAGSHPVGSGIGAAVGGAAVGVGAGLASGAATGAVAGTTAGPVGTVVGAVVGGVVGGLIGKGIAEGVDPTEEHGYWRQNYGTRPYADRTTPYEQYAPAYQYGWESQPKYQGKTFEESESTLRRDWDKVKGKSELEWDRAKEAVRDSWNRTSTRRRGNADVER
ncbi:MAG TPA: hypothetical protein VHQ47_02785 [Phycisphaerae bacterium]|jgi:hypothetical protein|nr:hypothetical protein [Phycisphaerae bacterium]